MISMPQLSLTINNFVHLASNKSPSFLPLILLSGHPPDHHSTPHVEIREQLLGHVTKVNKLRSGALPKSMAEVGEFRRWFLTHIRPVPIFHM